MLRARKVLAYIVEKLELDQPSISSININDNSAAVLTADKNNDVDNNAAENLEKTLNDGEKTDEQETNTTINTGQDTTITKEEKNNNAMKPELWLELICQDQVIFDFK